MTASIEEAVLRVLASVAADGHADLAALLGEMRRLAERKRALRAAAAQSAGDRETARATMAAEAIWQAGGSASAALERWLSATTLSATESPAPDAGGDRGVLGVMALVVYGGLSTRTASRGATAGRHVETGVANLDITPVLETAERVLRNLGESIEGLETMIKEIDRQIAQLEAIAAALEKLGEALDQLLPRLLAAIGTDGDAQPCRPRDVNEAVAGLVLLGAASAQEDLKAIMRNVERMNDEKERFRATKQEINERAAGGARIDDAPGGGSPGPRMPRMAIALPAVVLLVLVSLGVAAALSPAGRPASTQLGPTAMAPGLVGASVEPAQSATAATTLATGPVETAPVATAGPASPSGVPATAPTGPAATAVPTKTPVTTPSPADPKAFISTVLGAAGDATSAADDIEKAASAGDFEAVALLAASLDDKIAASAKWLEAHPADACWSKAAASAADALGVIRDSASSIVLASKLPDEKAIADSLVAIRDAATVLETAAAEAAPC